MKEAQTKMAFDVIAWLPYIVFFVGVGFVCYLIEKRDRENRKRAKNIEQALTKMADKTEDR